MRCKLPQKGEHHLTDAVLRLLDALQVISFHQHFSTPFQDKTTLRQQAPRCCMLLRAMHASCNGYADVIAATRCERSASPRELALLASPTPALEPDCSTCRASAHRLTTRKTIDTPRRRRAAACASPTR
jgi:hypothetical protein